MPMSMGGLFSILVADGYQDIYLTNYWNSGLSIYPSLSQQYYNSNDNANANFQYQEQNQQYANDNQQYTNDNQQ